MEENPDPLECLRILQLLHNEDKTLGSWAHRLGPRLPQGFGFCLPLRFPANLFLGKTLVPVMINENCKWALYCVIVRHAHLLFYLGVSLNIDRFSPKDFPSYVVPKSLSSNQQPARVLSNCEGDFNWDVLTDHHHNRGYQPPRSCRNAMPHPRVDGMTYYVCAKSERPGQARTLWS